MDKAGRVHIKVDYLIVGKGISRRKFKHFKIYFCLFPYAKMHILRTHPWHYQTCDTICGNRMLISTTCSVTYEFSKRKAEYLCFEPGNVRSGSDSLSHPSSSHFLGASLPPSSLCTSLALLFCLEIP